MELRELSDSELSGIRQEKPAMYEHIEAVRQKKRPSVSVGTRRRVADLANRAASASPSLPRPMDASDEAGSAVLRITDVGQLSGF